MFDSVFRFRDSISEFSCHSVERPWERGMNWKSAKKCNQCIPWKKLKNDRHI